MNKKAEKKLDSEVKEVTVKDKNGKVIAVGHEKNGVLYGEYTWYNDDGTVYATVMYDNGKIISYKLKNNEQLEYENGLLVKKPGPTEYDREYYDSNNKLVKAEYYYPTGRIFKTIEYVGNGVFKVKMYTQNGKPSITGFRKDDETKVGKWTEYYANSTKVYRITEYDNTGEEVEVTMYFKDDGAIYWHKKIYDKDNWESEEYLSANVLQKKVIVKDGLKTLYWFRSSGTLSSITHYDKDGKEHGEEIKYKSNDGAYFGEEVVTLWEHGKVISETKRIM